MIGWPQILIVAFMTGVAVAVSAVVVRWPLSVTIAATVAAVILLSVWRGVSNLLELNGDFLPAISVADVGGLVVGAVGPVLAALPLDVSRGRKWLPAVAGGAVGFVANVVII